MSHVRSEEKEEKEEKTNQDKTPSPIGAGLPLLQRLRLLKEKQVGRITHISTFSVQTLKIINLYL